VTELVGADFILNVVITQAREIAGVFAGHYNSAHLAGCDMVYRHSVIDLENRVDMVITSGGGFPLDATFYQISKALICARDILSRGGTIVVACECREGLGNPEFCEIMRSGCGYQEFCKEYSDPKDFVIDQWCSQSIFQAVDHAGPIYVYSPGMTGDDLKAMGMIKIDDLQETVDRLLPQHEKVMVVPEGPYVVGRVRN
jgi:lactate racemase